LVEKVENKLEELDKTDPRLLAKDFSSKLAKQIEDLNIALEKKVPKTAAFENQMTRLNTDLETLRHDVKQIKNLKVQRMERPVNKEAQIKNISKPYRVMPVPQMVPEVPLVSERQNTEEVRSLEQRIRQLEAMLRQNISNKPIIIE
jgi:hypothetical protein